MIIKGHLVLILSEEPLSTNCDRLPPLTEGEIVGKVPLTDLQLMALDRHTPGVISFQYNSQLSDDDEMFSLKVTGPREVARSVHLATKRMCARAYIPFVCL